MAAGISASAWCTHGSSACDYSRPGTLCRIGCRYTSALDTLSLLKTPVIGGGFFRKSRQPVPGMLPGAERPKRAPYRLAQTDLADLVARAVKAFGPDSPQ